MEFVRKPTNRTRKGLVEKAGINDADYATSYKAGGKYIVCPYYRKWKNMLKRCYSLAYLNKHPTYRDCKVDTEWLKFSNFREWMITQDWQGKDLDKDLLIKGNKIYSPSLCVFINPSTNLAIAKSGKKDVRLLAGVTYTKSNTKYVAVVHKGTPSKKTYLGTYSTEVEAHNVWRLEKANHFRCLAKRESDKRVKNALCKMARDLEILV